SGVMPPSTRHASSYPPHRSRQPQRTTDTSQLNVAAASSGSGGSRDGADINLVSPPDPRAAPTERVAQSEATPPEQEPGPGDSTRSARAERHPTARRPPRG